MAKVLILYYSAYGHIETMAHAVAEGVRDGGATGGRYAARVTGVCMRQNSRGE